MNFMKNMKERIGVIGLFGMALVFLFIVLLISSVSHEGGFAITLMIPAVFGMATLTADTPRGKILGNINEIPVIAADIIYEGAAVGSVKASGHARPLTSADTFEGFAESKADNSAGAAAGINVRMLTRGVVKLSVSGAVITDVGQPVYATDDNTFVFLPTGAVYIGRVIRWVSSGVVEVAFDAAEGVDPYGDATRETISVDKTLDAEDSGKTFFINTDAKVVTLPAVAGLSGITLVNIGAYGTVLLTVSPNAADMIEAPDITAADDKDLLNTKATAQRGDKVVIDYGDANGWVCRELVGVWVREA